MREIEFHIGLADKPAYACRLVRKAWQRGARVVVTGSADQLARLDVLLWTFDPGEFIPHARLRTGEQPPAALARTPVWLAEQSDAAGPADVLVNLGPDRPVDLAPFGRVIELLSEEPDDLQAGRQRWRDYKADGHTPRDVRQAAPG